MIRFARWVALASAGALVPVAFAQDVYVYPAQGQSPDQQQLDEAQCYAYAKNQTGFDPMTRPTASQPAPQQEGSVVGGAARGAALGAAVGAIAGDAKKGASIGAASGGMMGGMRKRDSQRKQQQWEQQQVAQYEQNRHNYNRAYSACLQGRGYTVN
ncbi:MAG: YMGG-like glycine zipper-containing protein [Gammaproteobacteria bacterium]|jgi:hypothetical protein